ncbi:MAG: acetate--CoA ligase family protein, partial [Blastocatellia bacterium]
CLAALCDEPGLDALLVIFIPPLVTPSTEIARVVGEVLAARPALDRTVTAVFLDPQAHLTTITAGARHVPVYEFPESAVAALAAAARYGVWRNTPAGNYPSVNIDRAALDTVLNENGAGWLSQDACAKLLGSVGIHIIQPQIAGSANEAATIAQTLNRPLALKIHEPAILHKTDVGGVLLNIAPAEAAAAYDKLAAQLAAHGIALAAASLTPMAAPGVEMLAGVTHDPVFGPLVACGSGGVLVELLNDIAFRVLPLTDADAAALVRGTRAWRLLQGYRGGAAADVAALESLLLALGALAEAAPRIAEIDLNPVIVHPAGEGLSLIDARVRLTTALV